MAKSCVANRPATGPSASAACLAVASGARTLMAAAVATMMKMLIRLQKIDPATVSILSPA